MIKLDYSKLQCPHPVVETRKQMLANPGQTFSVLVGDQIARENLSRLADKMGYAVSCSDETVGIRLLLSPAASVQTSQSAHVEPAAQQPAAGRTVIFCASDQMGQGDEAFGHILLKNFFATLLELAPLPDTILFVNSGVQLVCEGSEALEALTQLADRDVDIASCGLCLDFYELKDKLQVGRVTNMLEIAEAQMQAARIIRP